MYIPWTDEETTILRDMVEKGADYPELQKVFSSRTKKAIEGKIRELELVIYRRATVNHSAYQEFLQSIKGQKVKRA